MLRTAMFRGAPFEMEDLEEEPPAAFNIIHEFPGRDDAFAEPDGKFIHRLVCNAHLIGPDYIAKAQRLAKALAVPGAGTLVHPLKGELNVALPADAGAPSFKYSTKEGGMARVRLTFVVVGKPKSPDLDVDTGLSLIQSASATIGSFSLPRLDLSGFNSINKAANAILAGPRGVNRMLLQLNARIQGTIGIVDDFSTVISDFGTQAGNLLKQPDMLAAKMKGLLNSILGVFSDLDFELNGGDRQPPSVRIALALANLDIAGRFGDEHPDVVGTSAARVQERTNQNELVDLVEAVALAETVKLFVDLELDSNEQANEVLDAVGEIFERIEERESVTDEQWQLLKQLRTDFYMHMQRVTSDLTGLATFTPPVTMSAVQLSYRLYADATREGEIVARNGIEHPTFIQARVPIAVADA